MNVGTALMGAGALLMLGLLASLLPRIFLRDQ